MTRVKVCGITAEDDRTAAIEAGADALGFLVDVPVDTARELTPKRAAELIEGLPPLLTSVLVTMPRGADRALELLELTGAAAIQLHNDLSVDTVAAVADGTQADVLKAIDADMAGAERYAPVVDALLVDSRTESGAGGTGRRSDWEQAAAVRRGVDCPVILAGGLTPENVSAAVANVDPYAVDVSSGVERTEGRKDHGAVRAFIEAVDRQPARP